MDLHVVMAANDDYTPYMGTSMLSLLDNNANQFAHIFFWVIDNGISEANKRKLKEQAEEFGADVSFKNVKKNLLRITLPVENQIWDKSIFGRFFLGEIVPDYVERVLYLDGDTIVRGEIKELLETDLHGNWIAGVTDVSEGTSKRDMGGLDRYVNSGVLLIDMVQWRKQNIQEKLITFINTWTGKIRYPDQDVINAVCAGKIELLELKYNFGMDCQELILPVVYDKGLFGSSYEEVYECVKNDFSNVVIWHYFGERKPWRKAEWSKVPENDFLKYYNKSRWKQRRKYANRKSMLLNWFFYIPKRKVQAVWRFLLGEKCYDTIYLKLFRKIWKRREDNRLKTPVQNKIGC